MYRLSPAMSWLLGLASFVVIVAGMKAARELIVPFLASLFLTVICYPALEWLQKKGMSTLFSLFVIIIVVSVSLLLVVAVVGSSLQNLTQHMDEYRDALESKTVVLRSWLEDKGVIKSKKTPTVETDSQMDSKVDSGIEIFQRFLADLAGLFGDIFWVLLITIFMLMEASSFPAKLAEITGNNPSRSDQADQIRNAIWQYATLKTMISMMVGGGVVVLLKILDVDYALLWGLIAFFFNFIPNVGSVIAAVPGVGMAIIQHDVTTAIYVTLGYALINLIFSNIVEPRVMGKGMGISALVVFLSLIFWGWVLGPIGMLLSVPLTTLVKLGLSANDDTRWMAVILGSEVPAERISLGSRSSTELDADA